MPKRNIRLRIVGEWSIIITGELESPAFGALSIVKGGENSLLWNTIFIMYPAG